MLRSVAQTARITPRLELYRGTRSRGDEIPCGKEEVSRTPLFKEKNPLFPATLLPLRVDRRELGCTWSTPGQVFSAGRLPMKNRESGQDAF